jgi:predicted 3-demethylubiquinone-9 3-methyltransferase (glyoxalase superfamily)
MQKITPFLWLESDALGAAKYYASIFKEAKIQNEEALDNTPSGSVQIVTIELFGQNFTLMAAGPMFKFTEAISFVVDCVDQDEVDYYWDHLTANGGEEGNCGWLKDKYGVSWQIVPRQLGELMGDSDRVKADRAMQAMLKMKKIDIAGLQKAYARN